MEREPATAQAPEATPLLEAVPQEVRARLLGLAVRRRYEAGEVLFLQDGPCAGLFIVQQGLVKVSKLSPEGREQVLRHIGAGGAFNEVAVFDGGPNPATATAAEATEALVIRREDLLEVIASTPGLAEVMIRSLAGRLRHLVELVEDLSFRHVSERVARILLQSISPHAGVGAGIEPGRRISQREIAEMAGTSREVVARALRSLEASGAIRVERGEIEFVAPERLARLS